MQLKKKIDKININNGIWRFQTHDFWLINKAFFKILIVFIKTKILDGMKYPDLISQASHVTEKQRVALRKSKVWHIVDI